MAAGRPRQRRRCTGRLPKLRSRVPEPERSGEHRGSRRVQLRGAKPCRHVPAGPLTCRCHPNRANAGDRRRRPRSSVRCAGRLRPADRQSHRKYRNEGGETTVFEVTARLEVREGELEGFKRTAAEIMRLTREKDTKTLRYDWFITPDGT